MSSSKHPKFNIGDFVYIPERFDCDIHKLIKVESEESVEKNLRQKAVGKIDRVYDYQMSTCGQFTYDVTMFDPNRLSLFIMGPVKEQFCHPLSVLEQIKKEKAVKEKIKSWTS
jgi:hypothetical protein